jgi:hypothetical protein
MQIARTVSTDEIPEAFRVLDAAKDMPKAHK